MKRLLSGLLVVVATALPVRAEDILTIKITKGIESALPIAIVPFGWAGATPAPGDVAGIVAADLARSGRFAPMPFEDLPGRPTDFAEVNFRDWRLLGMENLVIGRMSATAAGQYEIEFRLVDVFRGRQLVGFKVPASERNLRFTAHQVADIIYKALTGEAGAFATRVAYVVAEGKGDPKKGGRGKTYRLQLADADGYDPRTLLTSKEPLLSPAWAPDGRRIAYVSFEDRNSAIWVQDVETGKGEQVSGGVGINSAPAWSPDGRRLAMTLSRDGNPEIYILDLATRRFQRVTNNLAIDTEPAWSPDGTSLVFTSDRGGSPQIYSVDLRDGTTRRVTYDVGKYNARASYSPDGKRLVLVNGDGRNFRIATLELATGTLEKLTETRLDESPSFAPNGSMIIYTTAGPRGTELAAVSTDGRVRQRLTQSVGEVREPDWGPFLR
ncbi:MAG: Tol-Pal system beta propeller repeat protein TolB [Gammaproteobacteria bacterium]|nr:Tol-Pal system beta propeller repeat protein TolB [Gammaproteobacteria bacterium]